MGLLDVLRAIVVGNRPLVGDVLPARPLPQVPPSDGRTAALEALKGYVCALQFNRAGNAPTSSPVAFQVSPANFHVDYPDGEYAVDLASGTCAVVPTGRYRYEPTGLTTFFDEASFDVFGKGTALQVMSTYVELFNLEYRCALVQQRRAFKGGVEVAFSPVEGVAALRLATRGYYGQPATFVLQDGALFDSQDEARGRRSVQLGVELRVQVVRLVNVSTLKPVVQVYTDVDEATGAPIGPTAVTLPPGA